MNLLNKLKYILVAIIILILGYFFGTIILIVIGIIIALISLFFIFSLIFHKSISIITNKGMILFLSMIFSSAIPILILLNFWDRIITPIASKAVAITLIWVISAILFGTFWNLLVIRKRVSYRNHVIEYKELKPGLQVKDLLFMLIIPIIITISLGIINSLI